MFGITALVRAIADLATELQAFTGWLRTTRLDAEADYEAAKQSRANETAELLHAGDNGQHKSAKPSRQRT